jgi:hypothetical protein
VYVGLEQAASEISTFESALVPGLLQTPDYARAVIEAELPDAPPTEVDRAFSILTFPELADPPVVYLESRPGSLYAEGSGAHTYVRIFRTLQADAISPKASIDMVRDVAKTL